MKKSIGIILILIAALIIVFVATGTYVVKENEYALVIRFSKVEQSVSEAGLHFKVPFIDTVKTYPKNIQLYDLQPSDVLTSDSKAMSVDSYVMWKISDPFTFHKTLGSVIEAQSRLDAATYNALKNIIGTMLQEEIITQSTEDVGGRDDLNLAVYEKVKELTTSYGIEISDVKIKRFDLPTENEEAVFARMIAERNQITQKYLAEGQSEANMIRNDVDKQVNIIKSDAEAAAEQIIAEGEGEYMKLLAEAYNTAEKQEFYTFIRALDALEATLTGSNSKTVILGADSELGRILMGQLLAEESGK